MNCSYCNFTTTYPSKWIRHCATKKHIKNSQITAREQPENSQNSQNSQEPKNNSQNSKNNSQEPENNSQENSQKNIKPLSKFYGYCEFCNKGFKHQQSLSKHKKYRCKKMRQEQEQQQQPTTKNPI